MRESEIVLCTILMCMLALSLVSTTLAYGPRMNDLLVHIYLNPDVENADLEACNVDINDWPFAKEWVQRWLLMLNLITMKSYSEPGMYEFDMNNQEWPTGHGYAHKDHFYDPMCIWCGKAWTFRQAIAYLTDKNDYTDQILDRWWSCESDNLVIRIDLPLPQAQHRLYWPPNVVPYEYDKTKAKKLLDDAGFTVLPSGVRQDPMNPGHSLAPLDFYIRLDDPNRVMAGLKLTEKLTSVGIPVNAHILPRVDCYKHVMVFYGYHLYTGGWSLSKIPAQYYDLYHSSQYWGPDIGWSPNYPGFCNHEFDAFAEKVKKPATLDEARSALKECGRLFLKYCPSIPLWSIRSFKAYKTGWEGVINDVLTGVDNWYSFFLMNRPVPTVIDWGFKTDIETLNVVCAEWLWDRKALDLIYDSMIRNDPIIGDPTRPEPFLATGWVTSSWDATGFGGDPDATLIVWALRPGVKWHGGTDLTIDDLKFTIDFVNKTGSGVAYNYPLVADVNETALGPGNSITVYMKHKSAWAVEWIGSLPIIRKDIWNLLTPGPQVRNYDPATQDLNGNGIFDLMEDGAGAWSYSSYVMGTYISLTAWRNYYFTPEEIKQHEQEKFHDWYGDVNYNGQVDIPDLALMARALGTNSTHYPHGTGWAQYNPDCDLDKDEDVDTLDLAVVTINYGA